MEWTANKSAWMNLKLFEHCVSSIVELIFINEIEGMNNIHTHTHTHTYIYIYIYIGEEERREGRTKTESDHKSRVEHHPLTVFSSNLNVCSHTSTRSLPSLFHGDRIYEINR